MRSTNSISYQRPMPCIGRFCFRWPSRIISFVRCSAGRLRSFAKATRNTTPKTNSMHAKKSWPLSVRPGGERPAENNP